MWVTTPTLLPLLPIIPSTSITITPPPPPNFYPTTTFTRRRHLVATAAASSKDIGGLGQAVLSALKSSPPKTTQKDPSPTPQRNVKVKPKGEESKEEGVESKGKELSGSDILWALQKASAKKAQVSTNKKRQMKNGSGVQLKSKNANQVDGYNKVQVRPIVVKSDWATRLDDLEKRLQEFLSI